MGIMGKSTNVFIALTMVAGLASSASAADGPSFAYSGDTGPGFWSETPGWETCARSTEPGARQTPINIRKATEDDSLGPLQLTLLDTELHLINNGHTIEQEYETGSSLNVGGAPFDLLQFHFHTQSEHAVRGKRGVMELHAVFRDAMSGDLAVVGVLYKLGKKSEFLADLMAEGLPEKAGDTVISHHEVNLSDALTDAGSYYTYPGSLTTPPCSEIVTWFVLTEQATMSQAQFKSFNNIMGNNFRPLQARNNRTVRVTASDDDDDDD